MKRRVMWFLAHPAWSGISGILAVVALIVGFFATQGSAPEPDPTGTEAAQPEQVSTSIAPDDFLNRFGDALARHRFQPGANPIKLTPETFTSDTAQRILDQAASGSVLYFRKGTYRIQELQIRKPLLLLGEDATETKFIFTRWGLSARAPVAGPPVWIANLSIDYAGNDALMFAVETRGPTVLSQSRITASSLFEPFLIIPLGGSLLVENSVLTVPPSAAAAVMVMNRGDGSDPEITLRNNAFVAGRGTTIFAQTGDAVTDARQRPRVELSDNVFVSDGSGGEDAPLFIETVGEDARNIDLGLARNAFVGWGPAALGDIMLGRRDSETMYLQETPLDALYYRTSVDASAPGPLPVGAVPTR